jgi:hypothetical protein
MTLGNMRELGVQAASAVRPYTEVPLSRRTSRNRSTTSSVRIGPSLVMSARPRRCGRRLKLCVPHQALIDVSSPQQGWATFAETGRGALSGWDGKISLYRRRNGR